MWLFSKWLFGLLLQLMGGELVTTAVATAMAQALTPLLTCCSYRANRSVRAQA
jgi:hypothetical protein